MNFTFTEDQNTFADATRAVLTAEVTADRIRDRWLTASGIDGPLLQQIQELGLPGMLVPEALGGLGLGQTDFVMMAQTCGYVACPEPIAEQAMVTAPLLVDVLDKGLGNGSVQTALDALQGGAMVATGHPINPFINFARMFGGTDCTMSVPTYPGATAFTVTPTPAPSCAKAFVKPCMPDFAAA